MNKNQKQKQYLYYLIGIIGVIGLLIIDQLTKFWAVTKLKPLGSDGIPLIPNTLKFLYLENRGAAFGLMQDKQWFFIILSLLFTVIAIVIYYKLPHEKKYLLLHIATISLIAGALGNCIDRIQYNYVVDFIYFELIDFPIFNFADICVVCGAILLFILILFVYKEEDFQFLNKKKKKEL